MSKREDQDYAAWVEEIKATLPDEDAVDAFQTFAATDTGREVYRGNLREKDYYTRLNKLNSDKEDFIAEKEELRQAQNELTEWFENEEPIRAALIKERNELRKQQEGGKSSDAGDPPNVVSGISQEELALLRAKATKIDAMDKILPSVMGDFGRAIQDAARNNYNVDPAEIMQVASSKGIDPYRAYLELTANDRKTREEEEFKAEKKKWFDEGRKAALSGDAPDHIKPSGPSVYDLLTKEPPPQEHDASVPLKSGQRVEEALRLYREGDF
jgi:hypothetical protein